MCNNPSDSERSHCTSASTSPGTSPLTGSIGRRRSRPGRAGGTTRGAALIIVLAMLVLMTVVVMCFFVSVSVERRESSAEANLIQARALSAATVDLVKSTISQATTGYESDNSGTLDRTKMVSWASQPGLIHTWKRDGTPERTYRLYSSGELSVPGALDVINEGAEISSWRTGTSASYNSVWCDINAPGLSKDNKRSYPIMAPPATLDPVSGVPTDDPATPTVQEGVQGFAVTSPPGFTMSIAPSATNNPAPMPVKWLYVLKDGRFVNPVPTGTPDEVKIEGATTDNPILGRVAYWTDDECSKVNVNTASEGTFWSYPVARFSGEVLLGRYQPSRNEFQRYPAHPATTSLSAIFPTLQPLTADSFMLSPRTEWGGSMGGTQQPVNPAMKIRTERLLATVDELLYKGEAGPRAQQSSTVVTKDQLEKSRFFLTAASRAPEETLFNTPRISMWPITTDKVGDSAITAETRQDYYDRTLKFCGTLAGRPYFFIRSDPLSPTVDYNLMPRNKELFAYLQDLLSKPIPGYGKSWDEKYGVDNRNALLVQAFDYIRSGPNLIRLGDATTSSGTRVKPGYTVTGTQINSMFNRLVVPIKIDKHNGMGNFLSITEVGLQFYVEKVEAIDKFNNVITPTTETYAGIPYTGVLPKDSAVRVRYTFRPLLDIGTYCPTLNWSRFGGYVNTQGGGPGAPTARTEKRSIRLQATGSAMSVTAKNNNGTGTGSIEMPWGKAAEMRQHPAGGSNWETGSTWSPNCFLLDMASGRIDNTGTGAPAWPANNAARGYSYRGTPIVMEFDVPVVASPYNFIDSDKPYQRTIYRLMAMLTRAGTSSSFENPPSGWSPRMSFSGGTIRVDLGFAAEGDSVTPPEIVQSVEITLPAMNNLPIPSATYAAGGINATTGAPYTINYNCFKTSPFVLPADQIDSINMIIGHFPSRWVQYNKTTPVAPFKNGVTGTDSSGLIQPGDVVRSVQLTGTAGCRGDWRLAHLQQLVPSGWFDDPTPALQTDFGLQTDQMRVHSFASTRDSQNVYSPHAAVLVQGLKFHLTSTYGYGANFFAQRYTSSNLTAATMNNGAPGDWNNEMGNEPDGAVFTMPEINSLGRVDTDPAIHNSYFNSYDISTPGTDGITDAQQYVLMYSPNRSMFSSMQFGTLLTEADAVAPKPWQTVLFCPNSASTVAGTQHPGEKTPPDHLFADLFWMPVVDPYPISDRLSTAGKININYQIAPFTYIRRATGMYALLKAMKLTALADSLATGKSSPAAQATYKFNGSSNPGTYPAASVPVRVPIAIEETLKAIDMRFETGGIFRSATAIAECFLYPVDPAVTYVAGEAPVRNWWTTRRLTGDNSRENPYSMLYPRTTTKSNTFTVHYRVQSLRKIRTDTAQDVWRESRDTVDAEYRGSSTIERYIDPNDTRLPDYGLPENYGKSLGTYYRWRTVSEKQFIP